ncbi:hypothetical protein QWY15_11435 [Planococcus sp. N064]|uniref:Uncharacterized protein n=1 Tax=Planococcus liqunii TaxID=3058394 RepID=A0ABT8MST3_9BACL|nr:hypothetical protein [Planococcus sp. N064]MDN7227911.1 hypothetical protein [Planococcus sp. N064]
MKKLLVSLTIVASLAAATDYSAANEQHTEFSKETNVSNIQDIINPLHRETDFS